ncbi:hypothetical protein OGATHE_004002 [Ogataea polymorpha]|uniref:Uncharacterized protein n=1 Tax=Ogataea polymorpha TaxID=460523 RepID=A0A9P8P583_9ASCO|nr:hypothetical protein OGATHE_004002 [Ogataea polymorpha]
MGHSFQGIDHRHTEVVSRVHFPRGAGTVVRSQVASVDDWVSQCLVQRSIIDLGSQTVLQALFGAVLHLLGENLEVLLDASVSSGRLQTIHSFSSHLFQRSVIAVCFALLDHLDGQIVHLLEIVGRVSNSVALDTQHLQVFQNRVLELDLLLGRISVIESDYQFSMVGLCKILVQDCSLGVANVQISRWLWRESSNDLAVLRVWEVNFEVGLVRLLLAAFCGLSNLGKRLGQKLNHSAKPVVCLQKLVPSSDVDVDGVLQNRSHHRVRTQCTPRSNVGKRNLIVNYERSEVQVRVQLFEISR